MKIYMISDHEQAQGWKYSTSTHTHGGRSTYGHSLLQAKISALARNADGETYLTFGVH